MFRYVYQDKLGNVVNTNLTHVTWEDKVTKVKVSPLPVFPTTEGSLPQKKTSFLLVLPKLPFTPCTLFGQDFATFFGTPFVPTRPHYN